MNDKSPGEQLSLEYHYKEYVRMSDRCVSYITSSFDDIKLYGAVAALLAWPPIVKAIFGEGSTSPAAAKDLVEMKEEVNTVLFLGFLAIHFLATTISVFTLMRQSLVVYYLHHLPPYERAIRTMLGDADMPTFRWTEEYRTWRRERVMSVASALLLLGLCVVMIFPTVVLFLRGRSDLGVSYLVASLLLNGIYMNAVRVVFGDEIRARFGRSRSGSAER